MKYRMLTISSNPNNILELESYLKDLEFDFILDDEKYADILISLTEAVNNAIIHGNKGDESKKVNIYMREKADGVAFCVTDEGAGFNHNRVPDPTCAEKLECCGGRGVYIMKMLADKIVFADNGSTVEMYFSIKRHSA